MFFYKKIKYFLKTSQAGSGVLILGILGYLSFFSTLASAQPRFQIWCSDSLVLSAMARQLPPLPARCVHVDSCTVFLQPYLQSLQQKGYLAASIDSLVQRDTTQITAYLHLGKSYQWLYLSTDSLPSDWRKKLQIKTTRSPIRPNTPINITQLIALQERVLRYAENNGYPFAATSLKNLYIDSLGQAQAYLAVDKNRFIRLENIEIEGNAVSKQYLSRYLGIQIGQPYRENVVRNSSQKLMEVPFLQPLSSPTVSFIDNTATISLHVKRKKASQFNLLLGVLPQTTTGGGQRYQITGEGLLHLQNVLGKGELLHTEFKSYPKSVLTFKTEVAYPYLPIVPIGLAAKFSLYARDTTYRDVIPALEIQYVWEGNNYIKMFWELQSSSLITLDTIQLKNTHRLPSITDIRRSFYGITYNREHLDYRVCPRRGWSFYLSGAIGKREVLANRAILALGERIGTDFQQQYDSLNRTTLQWKAEYIVSRFWKIGAYSALKTSIQGAYLSNQKAKLNELYRLGGNKLLRGFDEESIFAAWYNVLTLEYRYFLGQHSYLMVFTDLAHLQNPLIALAEDGNSTAKTNDFPYGFGTGITFETKAGLFAISYALGAEQGNRLNFRNGKIHLGYMSYF